LTPPWLLIARWILDITVKHTFDILSRVGEKLKGLEKIGLKIRNNLFLDTSDNTEYEVQKICTNILTRKANFSQPKFLPFSSIDI